MTQEDKELLLRDLCARLPYGVVIQEKCLEHDETFLPYAEDNKVVNIDVHEESVTTGGGSWYYIEEIKPYLLPLSNMTEQQKKELENMGWSIDDSVINNIIECLGNHRQFVTHFNCLALIEWCYKNHFDCRGLIPMGLAKNASELNIY